MNLNTKIAQASQTLCDGDIQSCHLTMRKCSHNTVHKHAGLVCLCLAAAVPPASLGETSNAVWRAVMTGGSCRSETDAGDLLRSSSTALTGRDWSTKQPKYHPVQSWSSWSPWTAETDWLRMENAL